MSKKELKAVEDAEFDTLMSKIEVEKKGDSKDTKTEVVAGDNGAKNKKKKEKAKAKKEADEKAEKAEKASKAKEVVADAPAAVELTPEEKKLAVKAAMEKRGNIVVPKTTKDGKEDIASFVKAEKDKLNGGKKKKVHGTESMY